MLTSLQLRVLFYLAVALWGLLLFLDGQPINRALLQPSSMVLAALILLATGFEKWGWRFRLLHPWFVDRPNLIGVYRGTFVSHWVNPETNARLAPIPAYMVIRQSFASIHIRTYTKESPACSIMASFVKADDGTQELIYTYRNEPRIEVRSRSPIHYGGAKLTIGKSPERLEGSYWTDRQTIGELRFVRISRKTCNSFEECESLQEQTSAVDSRRPAPDGIA